MSPDRKRKAPSSPADGRGLRGAPDAELVERCARGDQQAWRELVDRYRRLVYTIPYRMGLDPADADDVFQVTFARLAENVDRLKEPARVRAWLVTTARRLALNLTARTRRHEDEAALSTVADPAPLPSEEHRRLEDQQLVRIALSRLGDRCRQLLGQLYYPEEGGEKRSYEDVAAALGIPIGSIGPTRIRCLKKLLAEYRAITGDEA